MAEDKGLAGEIAKKAKPESAVPAVLSSFKPLVADVVPETFFEANTLSQVLSDLISGFSEDYGRARALAAQLCGGRFDEYGAVMTRYFAAWEKEGGSPSLPALAAVAIEEMALDVSDPLVRAFVMGAVLAEYPNGLQYHGNLHYRKVLCHAIRLAATNNAVFVGTERELGAHNVAKLLAAACIHDLGHLGGDNAREGVYTPGAMEQRAFDITRPYFEALGVAAEDMKDIETIVFCTDITFFAGDNSPCIRMKKIYKHYFWDDQNEDVSMMMMGKLRRYEDNKPLILMAMLLHEADVATSAGLSYDQTRRETISIMSERGVTNPGPRTVLAFLREQLGETLFTEAGKQIFGRVMADVISKAEKDILEGKLVFQA